MKIAFYAGKCLPIHAQSLEERPLGGTETAIIRVAELLAMAGHEVTVFSTHSKPAPSVPRYLPLSAISTKDSWDIFVTVKDWSPVFMPVQRVLTFFWTGDAYDQFINFGLGDARVVSKIDAFLAVSEWQKRTLCQASGFPLRKSFVIKNGVHLQDFAGSEDRKSLRLIYSSAPYRGLSLTPALFREAQKIHPNVEFHVYAGLSIYDTEKPFEGPESQEFQSLAQELKSIPGCSIHGNLTQKELAREMMKASIFFYPCTFPETSCISAMEALSAGCVVITSKYAGLPETVAETGVLVEGKPGSPEYMQNFVAATAELLSNHTLREAVSKAALERAHKEFGWEQVASRFEEVVQLYRDGSV